MDVWAIKPILSTKLFGYLFLQTGTSINAVTHTYLCIFFPAKSRHLLTFLGGFVVWIWTTDLTYLLHLKLKEFPEHWALHRVAVSCFVKHVAKNTLWSVK